MAWDQLGISNYWNQFQNDPAQLRAAMQQYGVTPEQIAAATGVGVGDILNRITPPAAPPTSEGNAYQTSPNDPFYSNGTLYTPIYDQNATANGITQASKPTGYTVYKYDPAANDNQTLYNGQPYTTIDNTGKQTGSGKLSGFSNQSALSEWGPFLMAGAGFGGAMLAGAGAAGAAGGAAAGEAAGGAAAGGAGAGAGAGAGGSGAFLGEAPWTATGGGSLGFGGAAGGTAGAAGGVAGGAGGTAGTVAGGAAGSGGVALGGAGGAGGAGGLAGSSAGMAAPAASNAAFNTALASGGSSAGGLLGGLGGYGSLVGPAASLAGGLYGASAAKSAANTQANAANNALGVEQNMFNKVIDLNEPFRQGGVAGMNALTTALGLTPGANSGWATKSFAPSDLTTDPSYQWRLDQGQQALERSAAAKGGLQSGGFAKDLTNYAQGAASQEYGNAFNRFQTNRTAQLAPLQSLAGVGQSAAGTVGSAAQNYGTNASNLITGAGNAQAAGQVGAANALSGAIGQGMSQYNNNSLMNLLLSRQAGATQGI